MHCYCSVLSANALLLLSANYCYCSVQMQVLTFVIAATTITLIAQHQTYKPAFK